MKLPIIMKQNKTKKEALASHNSQKGTKELNVKEKMAFSSSSKVAVLEKPFFSIVVAAIFFSLLWLALVIFEPALLCRIEELSLFLSNDVYFDGMMSVPAGFLSYLGCFLVQFFHIPLLGATVYVALLVLVYWLTRKAFSIPKRYALVALLPVVAIVASNSQLGYWIFYLKLPGYYFVALLGVIFSLLAVVAFRKLPFVARIPFVALWVFFGYPLMGIYALAGAVVMVLYGLSLSVKQHRGMVWSVIILVLAVVAIYAVPRYYYGQYGTIALESVYKAGTPSTQWTSAYVSKVVHETSSYWHNIKFYWIPFFLLLISYIVLAVVPVLKGFLSKIGRFPSIATISVVAVILVMTYFYWYRDTNFRIENKQNVAMWNEEWESVVELGKMTDNPTRQIVMNSNIALLRMGKAGEGMFENPHGSCEILSPVAVHLTQTGGKMLYYYYGKLNFCYRWCMEDAVEYGWRVEYLKHATRSMILSGEYTLARRYINILKHTMFHGEWAEEMEKYLDNPELVASEETFRLPLQMNCCGDALAVDDSFVEAFLTKDLMNMPENPSPEYIEAALMMALIRKDGNSFWALLDKYIHSCITLDSRGVPANKLPKHYQEAYFVFRQLEMSKAPGQSIVDVNSLKNGFEKYFIDPAVEQRFLDSFVSKVSNINAMNNSFNRAFPDTVAVGTKNVVKTGEKYNASYFRHDFSDTYYYYYYFVRNIKTN